MRISIMALLFLCVSIAGCGASSVDEAGPSSTPTPITSSTPSSGVTPIPTATPAVSEFIFDDFEAGWGHFLDGGLNTSLSFEKTFSGISAVRMHGNVGVVSSFIQRSPMDLTNTESLSLGFWLYGDALADGDALLVDFSDGTQWQTLSRLVKGDDFGNGNFVNVSIVVSKEDYDFSQVARVRMTSETIANPIFIDDISISLFGYPKPIRTPSPDNGFSFDHSGVDSGCLGCHDNRIATGKSASHFTSSDECQLCHLVNNIDGWSALAYYSGTFDHTNVDTDCLICHNSVLAAGKGPLHIDSSNSCENCHSTAIGGWSLFLEGETFLHSGSASGRVSCHNGGVATGKGPTHIVSSDSCENCHVPNQPWVSTTGFDHTGIVDNCFSCHDGGIAEGKKEFHIPSSNACETCHSPTNGWWLDGDDVFDHGTISTGCISCHNGTIVSGKSSNHIPAGDACESCHVVGGKWNQVTVFSHEGITTNCISCHDGGIAEGKDVFHIASADNCEGCHVPDQGWLVEVGVAFSHANIVTGCLSCHNNTVTSGKGPNHIVSSDRCESCHSSGVTWSIEVFTHDGITTGCSSCHDGVTATGKSINHIPSPSTCESCHVPNNAWEFEAQIPFSHTGIDSGCVSCHNGVINTGKGINHVPSSNECQVCHNAGGDWLDAKFSHAGITSGCLACHNGVIATGKSATHIGSSNNCQTCHLADDNWRITVVNNFDHLDVNSNCVTCHDGAIATGKSVSHIPSGNACETCHVPGGSWTDATFNHDGITSGCSSCHNGGISTGKPSNHFVTTLECTACHQTSGWSPTAFTHPSNSSYPGDHNVALSCVSCHSSNQETVPWPFSSLQDSCAGCHSNDYVSGPHRGATVSELKNCAGSCHRATPEHSVGDRSF